MNWNEQAACRGAWRRIFARSPICIEVMNEGKRRVPKYNKDGSRAKVDAVEYSCQVCNQWVRASVGGKSNIAVDHIIPVIDDESGFKDWNVFHDRLFCEKKNLQRICKPCHQVKTNAERNKRNTIKYTAELDQLCERWLAKEFDFGTFKKLLSKYKTKTRPQVIRDRATKIIENHLNPKKAKKRKKR